MKKAIISLSGGIDSSTLLAWCIEGGIQVECVSFQYGSKHNQYENKAAEEVATYYNVPFLGIIDISNIGTFLISDLLKSGNEIPEGHYDDDSMKRTVVPGRNLMFISILAAIAESRKADFVGLGIHQGDHHIYPDCRESFFNSARKTVELSTDGKVVIMAPFLKIDKAEIIQWGLDYLVPYNLTRTCYKDQPLSCGKCGSCVERLEGFDINLASDPINYE